MKSTAEMLNGETHCEHITRMHVSCDSPYPGDQPWITANTSFLYRPEYRALVNVENCVLLDGTIYLSDTATYRSVTIDREGNAVTSPIAVIPSVVRCCSPEYEGRLYYMTYEGHVRVYCLTDGTDRLFTDRSYPGYYLYLDEREAVLRILDGSGSTLETLPLTP